jgi:hypothetical protein
MVTGMTTTTIMTTATLTPTRMTTARVRRMHMHRA